MMESRKEKSKTPEKQEKATEDNVSKRKRKSSSGGAASSSAVEARTPLKRQRVPVQKFQSPAEEMVPIPSTSKQKDQIELLHKKGCFLGVRGDEGSFYLCKTAQNVFSNTRKFKIQWLDLDAPPDVYKIDFLDTTDADCILTNVRMERVARDTYKLPIKEQTRVEEILHKALKKERGEPIEEVVVPIDSGDDDEEEEDEDDEWEEEPTPKKAKVQSKSRKAITVSLKSAKVSKSKSSKDKTNKIKTDKKGSKEKKQKGKEEKKKKGPDRHLKPNPKIKVVEKELFFETNTRMDFVSKHVQGKLAIRAVLNKDHRLLKSLIEDVEKCYQLNVFRSVEVKKTALHYALERNDHEAIKLLAKDFFCKNERLEKGSPQAVLISERDTGSYNPMSLGIGAIRQISQARGSKQGNDAFVMPEIEEDQDHEGYVEDALKLGVTKESLDILMSSDTDSTKEDFMERAFSNVYLAVLCGNRKLAGQLIEWAMNEGSSCGFGYLHKDVLLFDKEELRATILAASVKKKPWANKSITPLHCAAINPNVSYLQRLLTVEPNINLEDRDHRRPIHFAAVCEGVGPLEFLLQRGASPLEVDNQGMTPLHYACSAGRPRNVDILLKKAKEAAAKQGDVAQSKWGAGGVDKPSRSSYCPIHIAVNYNHADVLKILIKHQVDINRPLSAGKNRVTPLMTAASHGSLEIARILVQNGASIEQLDKLKRTALTHAVMNGNTNVASYLLYLGADPNRCDSSDNSLVHYAAAYGWYFILKLLLDAGADPNKASYWKTTPIGIAFLKGHVGLVDYLLKQTDVDINFKNDAGMTLACIAASSAIAPGLPEQMQYLLDNKADPTIRDGNGADALHHLACNKTRSSWWNRNATDAKQREKLAEEKMDLIVKIAEMLLDAGCDPTIETDDGKTALMYAIETLNVKLVRLLVDRGATVTSHKSDNGKTILHLMADLCMETDMSPILKILVEDKPKPSESIKQPTKAEKKKVVIENGEVNENVELKEEGDQKKQEGEAMEVDDGEKKKEGVEDKTPKENGGGDAPINGDVNGMEIDDQPPKLERHVSQASQEDIWPIMADEIDHDGFTPLLWACKMYRDFKKGHKQTDEYVKKCSLNGRNFITALIQLVSSDVSATVKEKMFVNNPPIDKNARYTREGKSSVLHLLFHVGHEILEGMECLGLELVLKHSPALEHRNLYEETALIKALQSKSKKALSMLIKAGADVNAPFGTEATGIMSPLHIAADGGDADIVKMLLDAGANVKTVDTKTQETPLHIAVKSREDEGKVIELVQMLLAAGADVNAGVDTPLHNAVLANRGNSNASTELEEFLISKGANVFAKDEKARMPLHYAFSTKSNPDTKSPLDPIELCSVLTDSMKDKQLDKKDENGRSPLHLAAMRGATICCVHLLQRNVEILGLDNEGFSALSLAVKNRHDSCAIMLLQKGSSVVNNIVIPPAPKPDWREYHKTQSEKKKPVWVWTPSRIAEPIRKKETVDIYQMAISGELQGVAHMVLDSTGINGKAVEAALRVNKYHIVLRHLHRIKDNSKIKDYKNADGQNLLHILSLFTKPDFEKALQIKVAGVLVDKGVSLSQLDNFGRYPLAYVAFKHQPIELAKFFLEKSVGLDLNQKDKYSRTVMVAYFWNQDQIYEHRVDTDFMQLLVDAGASLDVLFTMIGSATPVFDMNFMGCPLDYFTQLDHSGQVTPLISAIYNSDFGLAKYILKNGASPNMADPEGITPLMHAVKVNDAAMVRLLLNHEYEIDSGKDEAFKPELKKKFSRRVFPLKPPSNDDKEEDESKSNDGDADEDEQDNGSEPLSDFEENDDDANEDNDDDDEGNNDDDHDADSDHDTDVMDDDEENEDEHDPEAQHLPLPRLGSKQPSMKRAASSFVNEAGEPIDEFKTVKKTSSVDLDCKDHKGWTVIHHVASPLAYGTFDNEEILYVLAKAGASLTIENKDGETPLKMAMKKSAVGLVQRLQTLIGTETQEVITTFPQFHPSTHKDNLEEACKYQPDAEAMLERLTPPAVEKKIKPKVDRQCMAVEYGEVVFDTDSDTPYDITLSKIEVRRFLTDTYNFYKMQVVWHKVKNIYILFTKWGRIGDSGQNQQTPFQKRSEAISEFCKIFKSKSGNLWSNLKSFKHQPKKYRPVETDSHPLPVVKIDFDLQSTIPSKLPEDVQDVIREMADIGMMQAAMKKAKMAEEYMSFGRIKREALITARKTLQQIGAHVLEMEKKKRTMAYDNDEHQADCEKVARLSTEYYCLIPQEGYTYDRVTPLNSISSVKMQLRIITVLLDLEIACQIMLGAQYKISEINPLDYIYKAMGCSIIPLREEDVESQYILKYIRSSSKKSKVLCIYKLFEAEKEKRFTSLNMTNRRMLWHGSGVSNFISILHRGLMVAPAEAPMTGHAFGEGIYTSDSFAKSAVYCYNQNPKSQVKLALLCEVALGNCKEDVDTTVEIDLIHSEYNSLKIHGRTAPHRDWDVTVPYGAKMPLSCASENNWKSLEKDHSPHVAYNEYIVQQQEQVCMRYLVQFV